MAGKTGSAQFKRRLRSGQVVQAVVVAHRAGLALHGLGGAQGDHVAGENLTGHDMVQQDVGQLRDVSQKGFNGAFGQFGKSLIGGSEDREGALALQGVDQACLLHGRDQRADLDAHLRARNPAR